MNTPALEVRSGILLFKGKISRNLLLEPMVSHSYFLEDGDELIIFDPACGRDMGKRIEAHIRSRQQAEVKWKKAFIIASHSHMDHANNFYLGDLMGGATETHVYIHEAGFQEGKLKNNPVPFIEDGVSESRKYYNPYLSFTFPYNLLIYPFSAMDAFSPKFARKMYSITGGMPWPAPMDGTIMPKPLRVADLEVTRLGDLEVQAWSVGGKFILPTPGHSPCSVSLFWPEKKALFVGDADWIGNPVFASVSLKDCMASLRQLKELAEVGFVELVLPAHGQVQEGRERILSHLDLRIRLLEVMRNEILAAHWSNGNVKDVRKLTKALVQESALFRMLKLSNYPRLVVFVHNVVAVCLKEEGILE